LQCVAVCCSVLQCVAVCCSVLQCVAVCRSVLQRSRSETGVFSNNTDGDDENCEKSNKVYRVAKTHRIHLVADHFP